MPKFGEKLSYQLTWREEIGLERVAMANYKPQGRRFYLNRKIDDSGISGTGVVAEGWLDPLGEAILVWVVGEHKSTEIHHSIEDLIEIHGHGDHTELVWID